MVVMNLTLKDTQPALSEAEYYLVADMHYSGSALSHGICRTDMGSIFKFLATFYSSLPFCNREKQHRG